MKAQRLGVYESAVEEKDHVEIGVVDESERTDATRFETKVSLHPFRRGKREFAGSSETLRNQHILEPMFDVMNCQIVITGEADQVMLVAFVVAHKDVLAMHTPVVLPPAFGFLYRLAFGVIVGRERNPVFAEIAQHVFLPLGYDLVVFHFFKRLIRMPDGIQY